jgi:hypothetical protein
MGQEGAKRGLPVVRHPDRTGIVEGAGRGCDQQVGTAARSMSSSGAFQ